MENNSYEIYLMMTSEDKEAEREKYEKAYNSELDITRVYELLYRGQYWKIKNNIETYICDDIKCEYAPSCRNTDRHMEINKDSFRKILVKYYEKIKDKCGPKICVYNYLQVYLHSFYVNYHTEPNYERYVEIERRNNKHFRYVGDEMA